MQNKKNVWIALVVVAIIAIGGYLYPKVDLSKIDLTSLEQKFGARPGPDTDSACTSQNGLITCTGRKPLVTATTTPCAWLSPSSTSTLSFSSAMVTVASSTATTWTLAKASTPFSTTTKLAAFSLSSGVQGTMRSTTTDAIGVDQVGIIAPNTWIVWGMAGVGSSYDSSKLAGYCSVEFKVL